MARAQRHKRKLGDSTDLSFIDTLVAELQHKEDVVPPGFISIRELSDRSGRPMDSVRSIVDTLVKEKAVETLILRVPTKTGMRLVLHIKPLKKISLP